MPRLLHVAFAVLLFTVSAAAQSIDRVSSDEGTIGDVITIDGSGFGTKKPKVELIDLELDKKAKGTTLKVTANTDSSLTVEIKKAKAGTYGLVVQPKGKGIEPIVSAGDFTIRAPMVQSTKGVGGMPGDEVQITVDFLGNKQPKVKVGGKKSPVRGVALATEGNGNTSLVTIKIPKSLPNGTWPVELTTPVGQGFAHSIVTVTGSTKKIGKASLKITVDSKKFKVSKKKLVVGSSDFGVEFVATKPEKGGERVLTVLIPYIPGTDMIPVAIEGVPSGSGLMSYEESGVGGGGTTTFGLGTMSAHLYASGDSKLVGAFSGVLTAAGAEEAGGAPVFVDGTFTVDVTTEVGMPPAAMFTTVQGLVVDTDLMPVAGADVSTSAGEETVTDGDGTFRFNDHPLLPEPLEITASMGQLLGVAIVADINAGGVTDAGIIVLDLDTDGDQLPDWYELFVTFTDPLLADTDGDGFDDGEEVKLGSDPLVFDPPTTIMGQVELPGRVPADGASLSIVGVPTDLFSATADGAGMFTFASPWPANLSPVTVTAKLVDMSGVFEGESLATPTVPDGVTIIAAFTIESSGSGGGTGLFEAATYYAGDVPRQFEIADLDEDGHADLVVVATGEPFDDRQVWVLLGDGEGGFGVGQSFSTMVDQFDSVGPRGLVVADFDQDENLDVAVTDIFDDKVSVLFGAGDGTFGLPQDYPTGDEGWDVTAADFDQDTFLDLAVVNRTDSSISVLLNQGDGTFGTAQTYATGDLPESIEVGLFDGNLFPDLVVANSGAGSVSVLLGIGNGTFGAASDFGVADEPRDLEIADLDDDGKLDVAVVGQADDEVSVLLGNGAGSFSASMEFATGTGFSNQPVGLSIADVDQDSTLDLLIANNLTSQVSVLIGAGDGSFGAPQEFTAGKLAMAVGVADFDEDGALDLAVPNQTADAVTILFGAGDGSFGAPKSFDADFIATSVAIADIDEDNIPDAIVTKNTTDLVSVLLGDGSGNFGVAQDFAAGQDLSDVAVADLDGDDHLDLAVANFASDDVSVLLGAGDGTFAAAQQFVAGNGPRALAVGLLDGDSLPDIVTANFNADRVSVLLGTGGGGFAAPQDYLVGDGPFDVAIGDFDKDGSADLAVTAQNDDSVSILFGVGDGSFGSLLALPVGDTPYGVAVTDISQDGSIDVVVTNEQSDDLSVILGNGDGSFLMAQTLPAYPASNDTFPGIFPRSVAIGDVNGDGLPDLVTANYLNQTFGVFLGLGGGNFAAIQTFITGSGVTGLALADLNLDGFLDVATGSEIIALWISLNKL